MEARGQMEMRRRRALPEILAEILTASPASWSGFRSTVGLNHAQAQRYLPYLITNGYLLGTPEARGAVKYHLTLKGERLLGVLGELAELLEAE